MWTPQQSKGAHVQASEVSSLEIQAKAAELE